jgi:predicted ATPase
VLCPEIIGRATEVEWLRGRVAGLVEGRGGVVALVGEAGVGKSRVLREANLDATDCTLAGRAVPGDSPVPYRPLAEALLTALRGRPLPRDPSLEGFEGQLARLVPSWGPGAPADESPALLGEAIVRLAAILAPDAGCVLIFEDLHWADPETLAGVDYLGDALRTGPTLCVCTSRPGGPSVELLERLERRDPGSVVRLRSLESAEVSAMIGSCLATSAPPAGLTDFVAEHSDGSPFLVEELLAGLVAAGSLRSTNARWEITGPLTP